MPDIREILDSYYEAVRSVYEEQDLICLSDNEHTYKDLNVLTLPINEDYKEPKFHAYKNLQDLINCTKDLKCFTGLLFLHRPFINNPFENPFELDGTVVYSYFQNKYDRRYSTFVSCCFERLYNFWDRIGDHLASFFKDMA